MAGMESLRGTFEMEPVVDVEAQKLLTPVTGQRGVGPATPGLSGTADPKKRFNVKWGVDHANGWSVGKALLAEGMAVLLFAVFASLVRSSGAGPFTGDFGIGGIVIVYGCVFSLISPVHFNPMVTVLYMIFGKEHIIVGLPRMVVQLAMQFAGAGIARAIVGAAAYAGAALVPSGIVNTAADLFVEFFCDVGLYIVAFVLMVRMRDTFVRNLILGLCIIVANTVAFPFTGAAFDIWRWLAVNAVGADNAVFFPSGWWIYLVAPVCATALAWIFIYLGRFMQQEEEKLHEE